MLLSCSAAVRNREHPERLEPALLRLLESRPDTVTQILLRLNRETTAQDQSQLKQQGLTLGSVRGRIVTGSLRAADARRLTRLPQVEWIELAGVVRITRDEHDTGEQ